MVMAHQVNPSDNGPTEKEEAYLECRLCKRWVLHSRGHIRSHLTMAHKSISLKEYFLNHVFNTGGSKEEEGSQIVFNSDGTIIQGGKTTVCRLLLKQHPIGQMLKKIDTKNILPGRAQTSLGAKGLAFQKVLKGLPVSRSIQNKCSFLCPYCKTVYRSFVDLERHYESLEGVCAGRGSHINHEHVVKEKFSYQCTLCKDFVLCDKRLFAIHLTNFHNMQLSEYERTCKNAEQKRNFVRGRRSVAKSFTRNLREYLETLKVSEEVSNKCVFRCKMCQKDFDNWNKMYHNHYGRTSTCKGSVSFKNVTDLLTVAMSHKCKICGELVLCDKARIQKHTFLIHRISLAHYTTFACGKNKNLQNVIIMERTKQEKVIEELEKVPIVPSSLFVSAVMPPQIVRREQTTFKVQNWCTFRCPLCSYPVKSYSTQRKHMRQRHNKSQCFNPEDVEEARVHTCMVCSRRVLCDISLIRSHVKQAHQMTLPEYRKLAGQSWKREDCFGLEKEQKEHAETRQRIPAVAPFSTIVVMPSNLPRDKTTTLTGNFCSFRCQGCKSFDTDSYFSLRQHSLTCVSVRDGVKKRGQYDPKTVLEAR